jgi:S-methylmethionine-dependent homocysteine/selenocysteine methylase
MQKIQHLKQRLANNETIIMDGGMGTEILNRGFPTTLPLWSAEVLLQHPEIVQNIHEDYIRAGAEIIITNTFRTTRRAFAKKGMAEKATAITLLACERVHQAVANTKPAREVYIAGSVAPLEDCYSPQLTPAQEELTVEHHELLSDLKNGGVDFILFETMITLRETLSGIHTAQQLALPFAVSFCCNEQSELLSGEALSDIIPQIVRYDPLFISINCVSVANASKLVKQLRTMTDLPIGVYAQGDGIVHDDQGWQFGDEKNEAAAYLLAAKQWREDGTLIVGGCCGTTPSYIQQLSTHFHE